MSETLVEVHKLHKSFGGLVATSNVSLTLKKGELHAIIGPNGAGKTTLIHQLSGRLRPDSGQIVICGRDATHLPVAARSRLGLARSFQITSLFTDFTVLDNVAMAVQASRGHSFHFWKDARSDRALRDPARVMLERLGLSGRADTLAGDISYGEQRQLEMAMALATEPRILLLDEPTAGMSHEESMKIVRMLEDLKKDYAILLVEHDMNAVFALADVITVLVDGKVLAVGQPADIRGNPDVRRAYLGEQKTDATRPRQNAMGGSHV